MVEHDEGRRPGGGQRETYLADDLTKIAEKLDALPDAVGRRGLSRADAVKFLAPQIEALRKKSYTTREVCEALSDAGLKVTPEQLWRLVPGGKSAARGLRGAGKPAAKAGSRTERGSKAGGSKAATREPPGFSVRPDRFEI